MPLRPTFKTKNERPISAIYVGNDPKLAKSSNAFAQLPPSSAPAHLVHNRTPSISSIPPGLPDLPEPPSPVLSNSSADSGLPSPPATNSTGSGSTGDPSTIAIRRLARVSDSRTMANGAETRNRNPGDSTLNRRPHHEVTNEHFFEGEYELDGEDVMDEDNTARIRLGGGPSAVIGKHGVAAASSENIAALARMKTLAERNKQTLDKLSRLASPTFSKRHSRTSSVAPSSSSSQTPSTSSRPPSSLASLSSTRSERFRTTRASLPPPVTPSTSNEQALSGSETERESTSSIYAHHPNNSSPSLQMHHHISQPLSAVSSSSSSSTSHSLTQNGYHMSSHAHTSGHHNSSSSITQPQPRTSKHHRIASLASASTPYLPTSSRVFQTPSPQPIAKTRSTGSTSIVGASGSATVNRMPSTGASTSSASRGGSRKSIDDGSTSTNSNSPRRRRAGFGSASMSIQGVQSMTSILPTDGETGPAKARRNTVREEEKDVAQAALAAVASSRSRSSLDTRRRSALPREFCHEVLDEDNYTHNPVTPYRGGTSASQIRHPDREVLTSTTSMRDRRPSLRGGSAESALMTRGPNTAEPTRSFISEVLKTVGLSPKRNRRVEVEQGKEREIRRVPLADSDVFRDRRGNWSPEEEILPISEFGERRERALAASRSATSVSLRRYASRSRSRARAGRTAYSDDEDSDDNGRGIREEDVTRTAPAGLRAYRHTYSTPREVERTEREVVHLSLMKKEREREREREREATMERSMTSLSKYSSSRHQVLPSSAALPGGTLHQDSKQPNSDRKYSSHVSVNHTGSAGDPERAASRQSSYFPAERTEHARLMLESLAMFEGHMARISSSSAADGAGCTAHVAELVRTAQTVVASADRLNGVLRSASKNAVEHEIDAEVADDMEVSENEGMGMYSARDMVKVWRAVSGDYKEGVKASDELVRGITTFLLGIGKVLRDMSASEGGSDRFPSTANSVASGSNTHTRSISLNDENIIRSTGGASPALSGGSGSRGGGNAIGRRSMDIARRGWEPSPSVVTSSSAREAALRRLTERSDGGAPSARTSSSMFSRDRDQEVKYESPLSSRHDPAFTTPAPGRSTTSLSSRRLQREQEQERQSCLPLSEPEELVGSTSQDTITPYEPSPSPAPRFRDTRNLPPLKIPRSLPSEPSLRQQNGTPDSNDYDSTESSTSRRTHERRKASNTSISTIRGSTGTPTYPAALNPSGGGATTAVTTHTVSNASPEMAPLSAASSSILSSESRRNLRSNVTFSKPSTESVPTLAVLQQQDEQRQQRTVNGGGSMPPTPMSGSETERPPKGQTWGVRAGLKGRAVVGVAPSTPNDRSGRVSLGRAADRSAAATSSLPHHMSSLNSLNGARKERKGLTEIFPAS